MQPTLEIGFTLDADITTGAAQLLLTMSDAHDSEDCGAITNGASDHMFDALSLGHDSGPGNDGGKGIPTPLAVGTPYAWQFTFDAQTPTCELAGTVQSAVNTEHGIVGPLSTATISANLASIAVQYAILYQFDP